MWLLAGLRDGTASALSVFEPNIATADGQHKDSRSPELTQSVRMAICLAFLGQRCHCAVGTGCDKLAIRDEANVYITAVNDWL